MRRTSFRIQPVRVLLGASGSISVADQNSWVVELWLPNHFTFCWCDMLTLTLLTIWLRWEQACSSKSSIAGRGETSCAGSSGSGITGRGETSFAGSNGSGSAGTKLVAVEWSLSPLWQSGFAGSGRLLAVEFSLSPLWQSGFARRKLVVVECSLSPLTIWLGQEQAGSGGILTLTSLTIWLRREQAGSGGSGFAGSGGSGFAGWGETSFVCSSGSGFARSKLVVVECSLLALWHSVFAGRKLLAVDLASLVAVDLASLGASR